MQSQWWAREADLRFQYSRKVTALKSEKRRKTYGRTLSRTDCHRLALTPERHEYGVEDGPRMVEQVGDPLVEADVGELPLDALGAQRTHQELKRKFR